METIRTFLKPVIDLQGTGAQIRRLRKLNGFSVHELQQIFGFEYPQAIYAWEQGKNAPTIDNLLVLAQLFKVDISEINKNTIYSIAMEECCELAQAISKINRDKANYDNTCEEIADVLICMAWIIEKNNLDKKEIQKWINYKVDRCNTRISMGDFK